MIDTSICEWLLDKADAPIRYRVLRELLKDKKIAKKIEKDLFENQAVKLWLKRLGTIDREPGSNEIHGTRDFYKGTLFFKVVQLGLHAELPPVVDAVQFYMDMMKNSVRRKPYAHFSEHNGGKNWALLSNLLTFVGFKDNEVLDCILSRLDEIYEFARKGDCDIYLSEEERAELKCVPSAWEDKEHFIKPELFTAYGQCWPLIHDILGFTKLYGTHSPETDRKIDVVIDFISNDDFHNTIAEGYGIIITTGKTKYKSNGWDPKYPGWFNVVEYIEKAYNKGAYSPDQPYNMAKLLFFAMYIVKYPVALNTRWFADLLCCLDKYKTETGTYIFPEEWLPDKTGYIMLGRNMSFGENRRKKNWREIESTFYMQLLNRNT